MPRDPRRSFGAHAADLRRCGLRCSLAHQRMRSVRCSAAPSISATCAPNLSPRSPAVIAGPPVTDTELPLDLFARGKVRDTYVLNDNELLMVATDRISAFDHVLPNGIPDRGKVLTQLSIFWFSQTDTFQPNHLISGMVPDLPAVLKNFREELAGRFMIVRKARRLDFECVVRGYLAGSAWKEYEESQTLAGETMPPGLQQSDKLAYPIFSPATKAETGHDENVTLEHMQKALGDGPSAAGAAASASIAAARPPLACRCRPAVATRPAREDAKPAPPRPTSRACRWPILPPRSRPPPSKCWWRKPWPPPPP